MNKEINLNKIILLLIIFIFVFGRNDFFYSDFFGILDLSNLDSLNLNTYNLFKNIFPYQLVQCPCVVLRFFEFPFASILHLILNFIFIVIFFLIICSPLFLFNLILNKSKNFKFRLFFFFLVYEAIFLLIYFIFNLISKFF